MTHFVRYSTLSMVLLGFFLSGCATTNKSTTADKITDTNTTTSANVNSSASDDTALLLNTSTSASPDTNASVKDIAPTTDNLKKEQREAYEGPVFKNAAPPATYPGFSKRDPWEPMNRAVFRFNESADDYVFRPVAKGYRWLMPDPLQTAVGNVFSNINDIPVTLNNLLQLKFGNAATSGMRLIVNTTFGLVGIFDLASDVGLEKHDEDFGQTLGYHGVASGPYLVLPFFGPSSIRDAGGRLIDAASDPVFVGSFFVAPFIGPVVGASRATDTRSNLLKSEKTLDEAALDKYEFMREAYLQRRRNLVHDGNPPPQKEDEDND